MKIIVNKDNVKITNKPTLHKGEYGVHKCEFEFSKEYDELVKVAVFRHQSDYETYKVDIIDNVCDIPTEVLERAGQLFLGVYAYTTDGEVLDLRYSPNMDVLNVAQGSYVESGKTPTEVTPSQYEMYSKALNDGLNELEEALEKLGEYEPSGGGSGTSDYSKLENKPAINNVELNGNKTLNELGIQPKGEYLTEIPSNYVTEETLNNKGYSTFSGNYNDLDNKPTIPTVPTNVGAFNNDVGYLKEDELKAITGELDGLSTEDKSNLVNAINEVFASSGGSTFTTFHNNIVYFSNWVDNKFTKMESGFYKSTYSGQTTVGIYSNSSQNHYSRSFVYEGSILLWNAEQNTLILFGYYDPTNKTNINTIKILSIKNTKISESTLSMLENAESIGGKKTFLQIPECATTPTADNHLTNKSYVDTSITAKTGELENLPTEDKSSLVNAITEMFNSSGGVSLEEVKAITGELDNLSTTEKSNLVNAINEVFASSGTDSSLVQSFSTKIFATKDNQTGFYKLTASSPEIYYYNNNGIKVMTRTVSRYATILWIKESNIAMLFNNGHITITAYDTSNKKIDINLSPEYINMLSEAQTITGLKTYTTLPETSVTPTSNNQLVNKKYVDDAIATLKAELTS